MTAWDVYWMMQADQLRGLFLLGAAVSGFSSFFLTLTFSEIGDEATVDGTKSFWRCVKWAWAATALFGAAAVVTPSTKTIAAMYVLPRLANNEQLQKDAGEVYELAVEALKEGLGEAAQAE